MSATVIPFPAKPDVAEDDPRLARVRELLAEAKPAVEPEMLKILRRIDRRLARLGTFEIGDQHGK